MPAMHAKIGLQTPVPVAAWLLAASIIALAPVAALAQTTQPWQAARVWVTGGDTSAWVIAEGRTPGDPLPTVQMWHAGPRVAAGAAPAQSSFLPPIAGRVLHAAADASGLRLLFSDLTTGDYFSDRPWTPGASWKEQSSEPPLAWGADAVEPAIYAVAMAPDLLSPTTQTAGGVSGGDAGAGAELADGAMDGLMVLELRRGRWRRLAGPAMAGRARRVWVCGVGGRIHLFWRSGVRMMHAEHRRNRWSEPAAAATFDEFQQAWVGASAEGPALIVAEGAIGQPCRLHLHVLRDDAWADWGPMRAGTDLLEAPAEQISVGIVRKQVAVARASASGGVEFGIGELTQTPLVRFSPLSLRSAAPALEQQWRDSLVMAALLAFLTIVMFMRRGEIGQPVVLPPGFVLSAVWRRVMATLFDLTPAYVLTAPWWYPKLDPALMQAMPHVSSEQMAEMWAAIRVEHYVTVGLYGLWCLVFEATIASTPGKLLFGCRVASTDGARPRLLQCVVRNAERALMVSMGVPGLMITLMAIVIVSRNRQRIGDLLARTVVIEPAPPATEAPPPPEDGSEAS